MYHRNSLLLENLVMLLLSMFFLQVAATPASTDCDNCLHGLCTSKETKHCLYGCKTGFWGKRCWNKCRKHECQQNTACYRNPVKDNDSWVYDCEVCPDGYYRGNTLDTYKCSQNCPENCRSCSDVNDCHECEEPYYNEGAYRNCSHRCPDNCMACLSSSFCTECKRPCYNGVSDTNCSLYYCPNNYQDCRSKICSECTDGYYNTSDYCERRCSKGCVNNTCDKETGTCTCRETYSGDKCCISTPNCKTCLTSSTCQECHSGYFGQRCEHNCSSTCLNDCHFISGHCRTCTKNRFGHFCEHRCSAGCMNISADETLCNSFSGVCFHGCKNGYFTANCDKICPEICQDGCDMHTGQCNQTCPVNCKRKNNLETCNKMSVCFNGCKRGYYGELCTKRCSKLCAYLICDRLSGDCTIERDEFDPGYVKNTDSKDSQGDCVKDIAVAVGCTLFVILLLISTGTLAAIHVRRRYLFIFVPRL